MQEHDVTLRVWLGRLAEAGDQQARADAIRALELLGHPGALPALAEIFATDPDPELRLAAQQAGKAIHYSAVRKAWESSGPSEAERQQAAEILACAEAKRPAGFRPR